MNTAESSAKPISPAPMIKFTIITLFPEALRPYLQTSMLWKAAEKGIVEYQLVDLRQYGLGPRHTVDDTPYGGGDGMLMRVEPIYAAVEAEKALDPAAEVILPTPAGRRWNQQLAREFAGVERRQATFGADGLIAVKSTPNHPTPVRPEKPRHYIIFCPHYEGYDQRILPLIDHQISLGNYVLTGGELPALIMIDSIVRLLPGVLGGENSADIESFSDGDNVEYPQYTRPEEFRGMKVPEVLLSGDHGAVAKWRQSQQGKAVN